MTLRAVPLLLALPLAVFGPERAVSEVPAQTDAPGFARAEALRASSSQVDARADGRIELAQKQPWAQGNPPPTDNKAGDAPDANAARQNALKQKQIQIEQAKQKAIQQQQDAIRARDAAQKSRQDAILKQKQIQAEQAKQKAIQQQDAIRARDAAQKSRLDAINKQKQIQAEQAKQKAVQQQQQTQDAIRARDAAQKSRQDALIKQKQLQAEQARQKALQQQQQTQDAIRARDAAKNNSWGQQQNSGKIIRDPARDEALKARDEAVRQKQLDAEAARQNALKARDQAVRQKQLDADAARQNALKQRQGAGPRPTWGTPPKAFDRGAADNEFQRARDQARDFHSHKPGDRSHGGGREVENFRPDGTRKFEDIRKGRKERTLFDGKRRDIIEPDNRVIVRQNDRSFIRHDESRRFQRTGREVRRERRKDGLTMIVTMGLAGALIYSLQDDDGQLYRRSRKDRDGREVVLIDNRNYYGRHRHSRFDEERDYRDAYVDLPPPRVRIPDDEYIVDYERASPDVVYDTLMAPPVERLERGYSLDEVRHSYSVLERMRRVDLDAVNFGFGSWEVGEDQYPKLESMAQAMLRIIKRSPDEVFLIEGHTDAVGSDIDNLSLSDRRAETVAIILSDVFDVPPENLTTQGYGEQYLKVPTEEPSRINRRVSIRRITPLLSKEGWNDVD